MAFIILSSLRWWMVLELNFRVKHGMRGFGKNFKEAKGGCKKWWWWIGVVCARVVGRPLTTYSLLHCPVSQELRNMVFSLFRVHWVIPHSVVELLTNCSGEFNRHRSKLLERMIHHCLMWIIWRERNT